ncbi:hypothetical protein HAHE_02320 [Haloferula helveola]|uniref:Uncharacterized protein n=1 Tax=Haloferula helveola TaxID=490095 RepID=A0ABN6GYE9_9BACT|nr:hypothetical protein HAHE_02320 [Haloferula helveola]
MRLLTKTFAVATTCLATAWAAPGKVTVRYVAQTAPKDLGMLVMAAAEGERSEAFDLPLNNLSEPLEAPARSFQLQTQEKSVKLAGVALPEDGKAFIILLVPAKKAGFEPVVIPDESDSFRPGDFYLHNVSSLPIGGKVGTTELLIPSRTGKVVRPKGARENRFYDVMIGVKEKTGSRLITSSRWPLNEQNRTYVFFFDNPTRGDVDFRAVDEFVPPKEKAKP